MMQGRRLSIDRGLGGGGGGRGLEDDGGAKFRNWLQEQGKKMASRRKSGWEGSRRGSVVSGAGEGSRRGSVVGGEMGGRDSVVARTESRMGGSLAGDPGVRLPAFLLHFFPASFFSCFLCFLHPLFPASFVTCFLGSCFLCFPLP